MSRLHEIAPQSACSYAKLDSYWGCSNPVPSQSNDSAVSSRRRIRENYHQMVRDAAGNLVPDPAVVDNSVSQTYDGPSMAPMGYDALYNQNSNCSGFSSIVSAYRGNGSNCMQAAQRKC